MAFISSHFLYIVRIIFPSYLVFEGAGQLFELPQGLTLDDYQTTEPDSSLNLPAELW